jgi:uncharacterized protein YfdQ (DUF2303 family)
MSLNDVESIADLVARATGPITVRGHDGREFLVMPEGFTEKEVSDPYGLKPYRPNYIHQAVTLQAVDSLVEYVIRYRSEETLLFADIAGDKVVAIVDYHGAATGDAKAGRANFGEHRATTTLIRSEEWKLWSGISGKLMPQLEFARFVEENAADVVAPDGAELLEAVRDLQAHRKVNFIKAVRTSSDNENFEFTDETEARTKGGL